MKTFARLIRRYVFAAVGLGLLLPALCIGLLVWLGWQTGQYMPQWAYSSGAIADSMVSTADGLTFGAEHTPQEWMDGYAWAMALDDDGNVFWHYNLPDLLNRRYAPTDVARFAHWYLADYPVFCWTEDYGLFVIALPQGSLRKYNFYSAPAVITHLIHSILPVCFGLLAIGLAVCFALSWRSARRLRTVSAGLDALADGQPVRLPTEGFTAELAEKLNQTSAHLQKQSEIIARRDQARTRWIAGVSHDVRTPLALILSWAEQLEQDSALPDETRQKAGNIRVQSEKLRALIADLNLTSKLQYGAQPLRREMLTAGPLIRRIAAKFCDSAETCALSLVQSDAAEHAQLWVDGALLERLLDNLLGNSVRHNPQPVQIRLQTDVSGGFLCIMVSDDGAGYPPDMLAALHAPEPLPNAPHILGLHVVEQIAAAHGGSAVFSQDTQHGAKAVVRLPLAGKDASI